MSTTNVETEVVQMRFDNKNFEKNVQETMNSVDKLKKELNFDAESKSFQKLEENTKKVSFNPLTEGLEKVRASFSLLDTFSFTVYQRLSNRLIDIGKKITGAVSTEGMSTGFRQYENKMNSFKTIQAAASKDFSDQFIDQQLKELTDYANKTIYSLEDMTTNISKFTNAGVKLDVAKEAIMGVANEAARSGANAQEASRAMYNFAQSLSVGHMQTIDWKSIENANMATQEFKQQLVDTGVELGMLKKTANGAYQTLDGTAVTVNGLRESLQKKWLTSDVLIKTLQKYADETTEIGKASFEAAKQVNTFHKMMDVLKESLQSNWASVWELIFGDLNTATKLWTGISEAVSNVTDTFFENRIEVLKLWKAHGGWDRTLAALKEILHGVHTVFEAIGDAYHKVFPKKSTEEKAQGLMRLTAALENFAKKLQPGTTLIKKITSTFKGLFSILSILKEAVSAFRKTFGSFFIRVLKDAISALFGVSGGIGEVLFKVNKSVKANKTFYTTFKAIVDVLEWVYGGVKKVADILWTFAKTVGSVAGELGGFKAFKEWAAGLWDAIKGLNISAVGKSIVAMFKALGRMIDRALERTFDFYTPLKEKIIDVKNRIVNSKIVTTVVGIFEKMVIGIQKAFDSIRKVKTDSVDELVDNTKKKFGVLDKIMNFFKAVWETLKGIALTIWPVIKQVFSSLKTGIQMLWKGLTENIKNSNLSDGGNLLKGIGIATILISMARFIKNIGTTAKRINKVMDGFFGVLKGAQHYLNATAIRSIASSILILVAAIFILCTIPADKVVTATGVIGMLFASLATTFKVYDKSASSMGTLVGVAGQALGIATAAAMLALVLKSLAKIDYDSGVKGVMMLVLLMRVLTSAINEIVGNRGKNGTTLLRLEGVSRTITAFARAMVYMMIPIAMINKIINSNKEYDESGNQISDGLGNVIVAFTLIIAAIRTIANSLTKLTKQNTTIQTSFGAMIGLTFAIKSIMKAFVYVSLIIALYGALLKHNVVGIGSIAVAFITITATIRFMLKSISTLLEMTAESDIGQMGKILALVASLSLFMTALAAVFIAMSILPSKWAKTATNALLGIAVSIGMLFVAFGAMSRLAEGDEAEMKRLTKVVWSIVGSMITLIAAIGIISRIMEKSKTGQLVAILAGTAVFLSLFMYAVGRSAKFAKGVEVTAKAMTGLGVAAAGFAVALLSIVATFAILKKLTAADMEQIVKNIKVFTNGLINVADDIAIVLATIVKMIVETIITTVFQTVTTSAKTIIEGLGQVLDILLAEAPKLADKALQVLSGILSGLLRSLQPFINQVMVFVVNLLLAIANAIREHGDEILDALDQVFDAAADLATKGVLRAIGLKDWEAGYKLLKPIIKNIGILLIGVFAYKKISKNADVIASIFKVLKNRIVAFASGIKTGGFANGWKEMLGINQLNKNWAYLQTKMKSEYISLGERMKFGAKTIAGALTVGAAIGLALGSLVKSFIDAKTEAIDAVHTMTAEIDKSFAELEDAIDEHTKSTKEKRQTYLDAMLGVDTKYDTTESKLNKLYDLIDTKTGRIKEGKEEEAKNLVNDVNSVLGEQLLIENGILKMLDAQGNARKFELEQLQAIVETERLREKVEASQERKNELTKEGGEIDEKKADYDKAVENYNKYKEEADNYAKSLEVYKTDRENLEQLYKVMHSSVATESDRTAYETALANFAEKWKMFGTGISGLENIMEGHYKDELDKVEKELTTKSDINNLHSDVVYRVEETKRKYENAINELNDLEAAERALETGIIDDIRTYNLVLSGAYNPRLSQAQMRAEAKKNAEKMAEAVDDVEHSVRSKVEGWYKSAKQYLETVGDTSELGKLDAIWAAYIQKFDQLNKAPKPAKTETDDNSDTSDWGSLIQSKLLKGESVGQIKADFKSQGIEGADSYIEEYTKEFQAKAGNITNAAEDTGLETTSLMGAAGSAGGEAYGNAFVDAMTALFTDNDEVSPIINKFFNGSIAEGLMEQLQSSIFPAIAGLTRNPSMFDGLFPVNFGGIQNGSGLFGVANAPAMSFATPLPYQDTLNNINTSLNKLTEKMVEQTTGITNEIKGLRSDVVDLGSRIDDMEVLLDGDALVGRLTPRINNALVTYSYRAGRGV